MPRKKDETGNVYGRLTALRVAGKNKQGNYTWLCQCECGNQTTVAEGSLRSGNTKSCGCLKAEDRRYKDETNNIYGQLTVLSPVGRNKHSRLIWLCQCECGNQTTVVGSSLRDGKTKSCGCLKAELCGYRDETNNIYGQLTVLSPAGSDKHSKYIWLCQCKCGNQITVAGGNLRSGNTQSCGCYRRQRLMKSETDKTNAVVYKEKIK